MTQTYTKEELQKSGFALHTSQNQKAKVQNEQIGYQRPIVDSGLCNKSQEYRKSFINYLRKGVVDNVLVEKNNEYNNNLRSSGLLLPNSMSDIITEKMSRLSVFRKFSTVLNTSRDIMKIPAYNNEINTNWGDGTTVANESDIFKKVTIEINTLSAQPKVTMDMIDDPDLDIEGYLSEILADIFLLEENKAFLTGDGMNKPRGILASSEIERILASEINFNSLSDLQSALSIRYENPNESVFITSKKGLAKIRSIQDSSGRYIFNSNTFNDNDNNTLFGTKLYVLNDMPDPVNGNDCVIYANLKKGYCIPNYEGITIHRDPFTSKPYSIFYAYKKVGGMIINPNAIKILKLN